MKWSNIKTTIFKELRGIVRDKKSMSTIIYMPLIIPFFVLLMGFMFDMINNTNYNIGINYELSSEEKEIVKGIGDLKFKTYKDEKDMSKAFENKDINGYIVKNDNKYVIYTDQSGNSGMMINSYLNSYLETYSKVLASNYLVEKGLDPQVVFSNISVESKNIGENNVDSLITILLSMCVTYVLMIIIQSCGVVATDATAGEKERGTLETILTFPVKSSELITGKYLAIAIFGIILGIVSLVITFPSLAIGKALFDSFKDVTINISFVTIMLVLLVIIVSSLLTAGVSMALAGKSKTYKEAQSSLQSLSFLPMIPYFVQILEVDTAIFNFLPIVNCGMALNNIIMGDVNPVNLLIIIGTTIVYTVLIIMFVSKQYKKEQTLFG